MDKYELRKTNDTKISNILKAIKEERNIYIVIEEYDAEILSEILFSDVIITHGDVNSGYEEYFKGAKVIIMHRDNEKDKEIVKRIKKKLEYYVYAIKSTLIPNIDKIDNSEIRKKICSVEWKYAMWIEKDEKPDGKFKEKIVQGKLEYFIGKTLNYYLIANGKNKKRKIYVYDAGVYKEISQENLKSYVKKYIPIHLVTDQILNSVTNLLVSNEINDPSILLGQDHIINLKNGLYNLETKRLEKHTPQYISENQLDICFNEKCINNGYWDKYIDTLTMGDIELKNVLQEWLGLIFSNYNGFLVKKMLMLIGERDTGKSKILNLIIELLGNDRNSSIKLQELGDKFALGDLEGKRLVSGGEIATDKMNAAAIEAIKMMTGGDTVPTEQKFESKSSTKFRGVLVYCGNHLPDMISTKFEAVFNRIMIVPCNNVIPKDLQDPFIYNKLLKDKEYILMWALTGLDRLIKNKFKFSYSKKIEDATNKYKKEVDNIGHFINKNFLITGNRKDRIKTSELYNSYVHWCTINSYGTSNKGDFKTRVCDIGIVHNEKYQGNPYYEGLILKVSEITDK
ncbi:MAG: phage/plasmid primase, P4 family [Clostridium sp.]|uniref:DNA primase family protein n=1 Tax=Clostridium sp. TaxID=1506 RepID=UPI002904E212|nr:phage/plasmid primase, P4 family [Clostridium sp.]MDU1604740.1 phage/plasmid primase, P4 family [Clostridium sp.]